MRATTGTSAQQATVAPMPTMIAKGAARQRGDHVLLGGHRDHDGDVHGRPEQHPLFEGLRQAARPAQPVGQQDQEQHGEAHAPHIRLDAQQDSQQVAQDDARKMTGGQGRHSVDDHVRKRRRRLTWFQLDGLKFQGSRSSIFA
jgi:hypothetical protein